MSPSINSTRPLPLSSVTPLLLLLCFRNSLGVDDEPTVSVSPSSSSIRTASRKRKEFSEDKRHAATSAPVLEIDPPPMANRRTLQVRGDLRRAKSNEEDITRKTPARSDLAQKRRVMQCTLRL